MKNKFFIILLGLISFSSLNGAAAERKSELGSNENKHGQQGMLSAITSIVSLVSGSGASSAVIEQMSELLKRVTDSSELDAIKKRLAVIESEEEKKKTTEAIIKILNAKYCMCERSAFSCLPCCW